MDRLTEKPLCGRKANIGSCRSDMLQRRWEGDAVLVLTLREWQEAAPFMRANGVRTVEIGLLEDVSSVGLA